MSAWSTLLLFVFAAGAGWYLAQEQAHFSPNKETVLNEKRSVRDLISVDASGVSPPVEKPVLESPQASVEPSQDILSLLESHRLDDALVLLRGDYSRYANKFDVLRRLGETMMDQNRMMEAIDLLYEMRNYVNFEDEQNLLATIHDLVEEVENRLAVKPVQPEILVQYYQDLVVRHPDFIPYYLKLATWQRLAGDFDGAEQSLIFTRNDPRYAAQAEQVLSQIERARQEQDNPSLKVPLTRVGKHFAVDVQINEERFARLMLDTGASLSVVKSDVLEGLRGLEPTGSLLMNTANGSVQGQKLRLSQLVMGDLTLVNLEVGALPLDSLKFDGLLGMDVLGRYEFFIDQETDELQLRPRASE
ncbi:MAG: retropepsin-like aspartic protease [Oleiphilaceae bacterium]|nr:retropepsin-like aspartic protease [Oleiphilaceae bacterium]